MVSRLTMVDEAAASKLTRQDYYRWVHENKPDWQREIKGA